MDTNDELRNTAVHEAGHATCVVSLCLPLTSTTAVAYGRTQGLTEFQCKEISLQNLIVTVAGDAAVRLFGSPGPDTSELNLNEHGSDGKSAAIIGNELARISGDDSNKKVNEIIDSATIWAEAILKANRSTILMIVGVLLRQGTIGPDHPVWKRIVSVGDIKDLTAKI
jgi:ATP-dependent Zn protease